MKAKKRFFLIAVPVLMAVALSSTRCNYNCPAVCINIVLILHYPDGQPVLLDSTKVFWVGQNRYLTLKEHQLGGGFWGYHGVVTCHTRGLGRRETMRFTGYLGGEVVHRQYVRIGVNRCGHFYLAGTNEPIVRVIYGVSDAVRKNKFCEFVNVEFVSVLMQSSIYALANTMSEELPHEDKLQMIVDWLLLHDCIKDAYVDYNDSQIAFSFLENGEIVNARLIISNTNWADIRFVE